MDKLDFIKIKSFCSVKNNIKKKKSTKYIPQARGRMFAEDMFD